MAVSRETIRDALAALLTTTLEGIGSHAKRFMVTRWQTLGGSRLWLR